MIEKLRIEAASVISFLAALVLEEFVGRLETVGELLFRPPAEFLGCARGRDDRALLFARTRRCVFGLGREISDARQRGIQIVDVGLDAGADVERDSGRARASG